MSYITQRDKSRVKKTPCISHCYHTSYTARPSHHPGSYNHNIWWRVQRKVRIRLFSPPNCHSLSRPNVLNNSHVKWPFGNTSFVPRLQQQSKNVHVVRIPLCLLGTVLLRPVIHETVFACNCTESWLWIIAKSSGEELCAADEMGGIWILSLLPVSKHYAQILTASQINRQADGLCRQTQHAYHPNYTGAATYASWINGLFNDAVSEWDHTAWNSSMISE
jgi:hypothetical protein